MRPTDQTIALSNPDGAQLGTIQKAGLAILAAGLFAALIALGVRENSQPWLFFIVSFGLVTVGTLIFIINTFLSQPPGVKNNGIWFKPISSRKNAAYLLGIIITVFYIVLYWFPGYLENWIRMCDPLSQLLRSKPADQWFLYGTFYTISIVIMGLRAILKYRHSPYQIIRTSSIIFFQLGFAYLIPALLQFLNQPEFYFSYFWPLKYNYLFPNDIHSLLSQPGGLGVFMVFWTAVMSLIATPILTYFFGKRWYCSWVCGCGGLANTAGDSFRQLSDKSLRAWKIERRTVYSVLVLIVLITALLWINSFSGGTVFGSLSTGLAKSYGFFIGAIFSGVIGVGFYPIMGTRVWCRFGCPMAAYLGILQKYFSRFRITTNGGQCISCGNCSTYCEMGIDVRWYAQRGQNIVRASCVGCGMCSTVCPRGVLNLENGPMHGRMENGPIQLSEKGPYIPS
ncbi:MAG: 4Fe-4S binding protein [Chitinophagales bacterium]|nr:4Fe-4S binding protein [Chitinophagales bacterium]